MNKRSFFFNVGFISVLETIRPQRVLEIEKGLEIFGRKFGYLGHATAYCSRTGADTRQPLPPFERRRMRLPFLLGRFLSRIDEGRAIEHRFRKTEIGRCEPGTPGLETSTSEGKIFRFFSRLSRHRGTTKFAGPTFRLFSCRLQPGERGINRLNA